MKLSSMQRFWLIQAITISLVILTGLSAVQGADTEKDQVAVKWYRYYASGTGE